MWRNINSSGYHHITVLLVLADSAFCSVLKCLLLNIIYYDMRKLGKHTVIIYTSGCITVQIKMSLLQSDFMRNLP